MYTPFLCLLLAAACMSAPVGFDIVKFEKDLQSQLEHTALHHIFKGTEQLRAEIERLVLHHSQRNTGKDLLKALEGSAIDSLTTATTGVVTSVVDKLVSGLTGKLTGVIGNLLGHIHIGKRNTGKDLLKALKGSAIDSLTTAATGVVSNAVEKLVSGLTGKLTGIIGSLIGRIGKRNAGDDLLKALQGAALTSVEGSLTPVIDKVINAAVSKLTSQVGNIATNLLGHIHLGKRSFGKDLLNTLKETLKGVEQTALQSLTGIAQSELTNLLGKYGKREVDILGQLSGVLGGFEGHITDVVQNTLSTLPALFEKELSTLLTLLGN